MYVTQNMMELQETVSMLYVIQKNTRKYIHIAFLCRKNG